MHMAGDVLAVEVGQVVVLAEVQVTADRVPVPPHGAGLRVGQPAQKAQAGGGEHPQRQPAATHRRAPDGAAGRAASEGAAPRQWTPRRERGGTRRRAGRQAGHTRSGALGPTTRSTTAGRSTPTTLARAVTLPSPVSV